MKLVRDHLFIGNITNANAVIQSSELKVTHMLSLLSNQVLSQPNPKPGDPYALVTMRGGVHYLPPTKPTENHSPESPGDETEERQNEGGPEFVRMTVPLRDMESENLLDHLEACLDFIEEGRKEGDVLVHCVAGVSRSASVITAYLMRTEKLSVDDALASLREGSPHVCPNDGFLEQLKMFEGMGFKVDHESPIYKQFHVTSLGDAYGKGEKIERSRFASDPGVDSTSLAESIGSQLKLHEENGVATLYRCRKCRRLVACQSNVISHSSGMEVPLFRSKRRGGGRGHDDDYGEPKCSSIFVEPMQWMTAGWLDVVSYRGACGGKAILCYLSSSTRKLPLGRSSVQLRSLGQSCIPAAQEPDGFDVDLTADRARTEWAGDGKLFKEKQSSSQIQFLYRT